jgi:hypothetical protein
MLDVRLSHLVGPKVTSFTPTSGYAATLVDIHGSNFSPHRTENEVEIGGEPALVVSATPTLLRASVAENVTTGPVKVRVNGHTATGSAIDTGAPQGFHRCRATKR